MPRTVWSHMQPFDCAGCSRRIRCKARVDVCKSCSELLVPGKGVTYYNTKDVGGDLPECEYCRILPSSKRDIRKMWVHLCVSCEKEMILSSLSFLQQLNPTPLSRDFEGDVSLIIVGSEEVVQAHRFILASKSQVFEKMMEAGMKENITGKVYIEGISADVVRAAVTCMYTAEINFNDGVTPVEVLRFADRYEVLWLKKRCEEELQKIITTRNLLELLSVSYLYRAEVLKTAVKAFFTKLDDNTQGDLLDGIFEGYVGPHSRA